MIEHKKNIGEEIIQARVLYYDFFAGLFLFELLKNRSDVLKKQINILKNFAFSDINVEDFDILEKELHKNGIGAFKEEFTVLFSLPFTPNNIPSGSPIYLYLSYYLEGCIGGKSLSMTKDIFKSSNFYLDYEHIKETEENFGVLLLTMEYFLQNQNMKSKELFNQCINPMITPITEGISKRKDCLLYGHINNILIEFLELEKKILM
ncbi:hypothetical protein BKH42_00325 [Helicobacter sp. 13S00482-2]|uniref:molecular chaperone TorD family protein n=1 Tax=Helicobacter sp. 13S00482-2 TaxID=1476200 RepID=UPI000BA6DD42|nr:molecular chaperone TorD family protein [Helicobacter sp. 13S00482-2]PAF54399.1 hypothetical protein BKH42_00325 [Helicobacter sp. 13S00482-2]